MPNRPAVVVLHSTSGLAFGFWPDKTDPTVLHITARHGTTADEAIATFMDGQTIWDGSHKRFETFTETHGLYWFWWERDRRVGVISCFLRKDG